MKRWAVWLSCWALVGACVVLPVTARAHPPDKWPGQVECHRHWWASTYQVQSLIQCAAKEVGVSVVTAVSVAACESGFNPRARGGAGGHYVGLYQHREEFWPSRAAAYGFKGFPWWNGRAAAWVSLRLARADGWSHWAGCL